MKKILLFLFIIISFWNIITVNAEEKNHSWTIAITVTEDIPWAGCEFNTWSDNWWLWTYTCHVEKWFKWVTSTLWNIIKWFTYLTWLAAVLFIIWNSIFYMRAGLDDWLKGKAKERIQATLMWIVLLLLTWVILNAIAPWIYK